MDKSVSNSTLVLEMCGDVSGLQKVPLCHPNINAVKRKPCITTRCLDERDAMLLMLSSRGAVAFCGDVLESYATDDNGSGCCLC